MKNKQMIVVAAVIFVMLSVLTWTVYVGSLGSRGSFDEEDGHGSAKLKVVATIFPLYDWAMNVVGADSESVDVSLLIDKGVDLHSHQPTVDEILRISTCDLFIYVGGESDDWVQDALKEAANKDIRAVNLIEELGDAVRTEELVEGMRQKRHEHDDEEEEEDEADEHVWLSVRNAAICAGVIKDAISRLDPENDAAYESNLARYVDQLEALDDEYQAAVGAASSRRLLFGDRFPFRYLVEDYGLDYYAAFPGCSAETEASFETIAFLADKIDELGIGAVMTIDGSDDKLARIIVQATKNKDQAILTLDSMQSINAKDMAAGATYLSIMEKNLEVLKEALG